MSWETPPLSENSVLYVYFSEVKTNPETLKIHSDPGIITHGEDIYYFGKVYAGLPPDEFGILVSERPDAKPEDEDIRKIASKFDPENNTGSFGVRIKNKTGDESLLLYLIPYAVYGEVVNTGEAVKVDWDSVKGILKENSVDGFLENNGLKYTGVMDFTLD